ncbi:hypothetical protein R3P38DRAFT_3117674 [Favolaschia claudopus]|uniref:Uncharacterized protein n=1 Tax=Favolaschia claudopus TaxID=2862362 RepID=A0AAV9ZEJ6_9AGAR
MYMDEAPSEQYKAWYVCRAVAQSLSSTPALSTNEQSDSQKIQTRMTYINGIAPIVTVRGPGNLHHLSYNSNGGIVNCVGIMPAPVAANENNTVTNFLLGFAYSFTGYAFYWDGAGPAFWRIAGSPFTEPVGTSWSAATGVPWGSQIDLGINVESEVATAANEDNEVIVYIIPGDLD